MRKACDVLKAFKETYEDHRIKLKSYFPEGTEPREWEFAPKLVFARYDKFCDRVETVRVIIYFFSSIALLRNQTFSAYQQRANSLITVFECTDSQCLTFFGYK